MKQSIIYNLSDYSVIHYQAMQLGKDNNFGVLSFKRFNVNVFL